MTEPIKSDVPPGWRFIDTRPTGFGEANNDPVESKPAEASTIAFLNVQGKPESKTMHYKNGREAKNGDKIMLIPTYGNPVVGILYDAVAGNDTCNGRIALIASNDPCPNLKECLHLDDVLAKVNGPNEAKPT